MSLHVQQQHVQLQHVLGTNFLVTLQTFSRFKCASSLRDSSNAFQMHKAAAASELIQGGSVFQLTPADKTICSRPVEIVICSGCRGRWRL